MTQEEKVTYDSCQLKLNGLLTQQTTADILGVRLNVEANAIVKKMNIPEEKLIKSDSLKQSKKS